MGRKSKYKNDFPKKANEMATAGMNDKQIAEALGISKMTFYEYEKKYPNFVDSLKKGREITNERVEDALFQRAMGYSHPDVDIRALGGKIVITPIIKHYPPDTTAAIFWLCNRSPDRWRSINRDVINDENNWTKEMKISGLNEEAI